MQHYIICPKSGGLFLFSDFQERSTQALLASSALYKIIYNYGKPIKISLGTSKMILKKGNVLFCKPLDCLKVVTNHTNLRIVAFNRDFYSLKTKEEETTFYRFWHYSFKHRLSIALNRIEKNFFNTVFSDIEQEFLYNAKSSLMQRNILKRIIKTISIKIQTSDNKVFLENNQLDIIKRFNQLIESHYQKNTSFESIVKKLPKHQSFIGKIIYKFFGKPRVVENTIDTKKNLIRKPRMPLNLKASEQAERSLINSKSIISEFSSN